MKKGILWRIILIASTVLISIVFFLPNTPIFDKMPNWWKKNMPSKGMVLGLDLQGGLHLVFEVDGEKAVEVSTERITSSLNGIFEKKKIKAEAKREGALVVITLNTPEVRKEIEKEYPILTIAETKDVLKYKISDKEAARIKDTATDQVVEIIRNRIDQFGVAEPIIHRQAGSEIVVQLPGVKDPKRAMELIGKTAQLEF
ncbi:MAG: protein translocase subunit SecD, partial [Nitrospirae bacterium]|nr:protein translocase subunit SecD [Nitrospirota bacterium]